MVRKLSNTLKNSKQSRFSYLIWDVDGTLYQSIPEFKAEYFTLHQKMLAAHFPDLSEEDREKTYRTMQKKTKSSTRAYSILGMGTLFRVSKYVEDNISHKKYLKKDPKLIELFRCIMALPNIVNIALRNGTTEGTKSRLSCLGLAELKYPNAELGPFHKVIGVVDTYNDIKPSTHIARNILEYAAVSPEKILWIGDRISVDLAPAKNLGMQTAYVWASTLNKEEEKIVDFVCETVYDVAELL